MGRIRFGTACALAMVTTALAQPPADHAPASAPPPAPAKATPPKPAPAKAPAAPASKAGEKPASKPTAESSDASRDYVRVAEDGSRITLQTAVHSFKPVKGPGPTIELVGVAHIGDKAYYAALQEFLDAQELVLYEGVRPGGMGASAMEDEEKVKTTERRIRLLAVLVERYRIKNGAYPADFAELQATLRGSMAKFASGAMVDGWGRPLKYMVVQGQVKSAEPDKPGARTGMFDIFSFGADGATGGQDLDGDLKYSAQKQLTRAELADRSEGIQSQLAAGLGLEFQLTAIDYERKNWRNSDLSIDEVQKKLDEDGASGEYLFRMLDGSSFSAKLLGFVLQVLKSNPQAQAQAKLMMIEALASADELLTNSMPGEMGKVFKVILHDRNEAVLADLKKVIADEKGVKSVALFYGAGHLPEIEDRLIRDFGYQRSGERYFSAIDLDTKQAGMSVDDVTRFRRMIQQAMQAGKPAPAKTR